MAKTKFEYNGYHFTPYMKLNATFEQKAMNLDHEKTLFPNYKSFSCEDFYRASPIKDCDIFICEENGKKYIPAYNLLEYKGELRGVNLLNAIPSKPKQSIIKQLSEKNDDTATNNDKSKKSTHEI